MNERIKQLIKQATVPGYMLGESYVQSRLDEQKFAELIVKECTLQCIHNEDMDLIEKHFGVKE